MPVKRRLAKARAGYPETIEHLVAGAPLEWSPEAWDEMLGVYFFGDHNLPSDARDRARHFLDEWRDHQLDHERQGCAAR
jgi:hypothetical protein